MGGDIKIESELGRGAQFSFTAKLLPRQETTTSTVHPKFSNNKVLFVSHDHINQKLVSQKLSKWHVTFDKLEGEKQAYLKLLDAVKRNTPYSILILDLEQEQILKKEFLILEKIAQNSEFKNLKIIVFSPIDEATLDSKQFPRVITHWLLKPIRQQQLFDALLNTIDSNNAEADVNKKLEKQFHQYQASVLLVEDNLVNQTVAKGMLELFGLNIDIAENGKLAIAAAASKQYDLILMDCHMPVMDGFESTQSIRKFEKAQHRTKKVPVIALTADVMKGIDDRCRAAGMDDFMAKPFELADVKRLLKKWLTEKTSDKKLPSPIQMTKLQPDLKTLPILDIKKLKEIRALQSPDKPEMFNQIIDIFKSDSRKLLDRLKAAIQNQDLLSAGNAAHALKSSSAHLGAMQFSSLCQKIETLCSEDQGQSLRVDINQIESLYVISLESIARATREESSFTAA